MENFLSFCCCPFLAKLQVEFLSLLVSYRPRWRPTVLEKYLQGGDLSLALHLGLLGGWKAKVSHLAICFDFAKSNFPAWWGWKFWSLQFQSQKGFWSKFKSRHGCYNPQRIICNHLKLWISWDAQEIKRFSISFGGDIFFATGGSWSQQLISENFCNPNSILKLISNYRSAGH